MICERPLPVFDVPQFVVSDSRVAYGRLCQALVGNPSRQMKVIGVTGTHGKTTVARLLSSIFRTAGGSAGTLDSFGYWDGYEDRPPLGWRVVAARVGPFAGRNGRGRRDARGRRSLQPRVEPTGAGRRDARRGLHHAGRPAITSTGTARSKTIARPSGEFSNTCIPMRSRSSTPTIRRRSQMLSELNQPALTYGMKLPAKSRPTIIEQYINEQTFVLSAGDDSVGVRTAIVGDHHVYNCLAAATMALAYGIELTTIARGLEAVDRLPGRMERVMCGQDFAVLVDAADSPDALRAACEPRGKSTSGRRDLRVRSHDECDPTELPAIGRVIGAMADVAVVTHGYPADGVAPHVHGTAKRLCRSAQSASHPRSQRGNCAGR